MSWLASQFPCEVSLFLCGAHNKSIVFSSHHSVNQPFKGDYLEISKNPKYQKLSSAVDEKVLLADVVNKINRANGKVQTHKMTRSSASPLSLLPFLLHPCGETAEG